jgi:hypothetical protein
MPLKQLPYFYETESDLAALPNGVQHRLVWSYSVEFTSQVDLDGKPHDLLVERLRQQDHYSFEDYVVVCACTHKWQYVYAPNLPYHHAVRGYRHYHEGQITKGGEIHLQPEAAVMLGFTPTPNVLPPYIATVPLATLTQLLIQAAAEFDDASPINAWLSIPVDAPTEAPSDVSQSMRKMREDIGLQVTRGRGRMLQYMMVATGVTLSATTGWALTPEEMVRRQSSSAAT